MAFSRPTSAAFGPTSTGGAVPGMPSPFVPPNQALRAKGMAQRPVMSPQGAFGPQNGGAPAPEASAPNPPPGPAPMPAPPMPQMQPVQQPQAPTLGVPNQAPGAPAAAAPGAGIHPGTALPEPPNMPPAPGPMPSLPGQQKLDANGRPIPQPMTKPTVAAFGQR